MADINFNFTSSGYSPSTPINFNFGEDEEEVSEFSILIGSAWKAVEPKILIAGNWKVISEIKILISGAWKTII